MMPPGFSGHRPFTTVTPPKRPASARLALPAGKTAPPTAPPVPPSRRRDLFPLPLPVHRRRTPPHSTPPMIQFPIGPAAGAPTLRG